MSLKGVYTALSGAIAQSQKMDNISNNIANVNTAGFKKDQAVFKEYLTEQQKDDPILETTKIPVSYDGIYDLKGHDKSYVEVDGTYTNYEQGSLKITQNPLDVAFEGPGFFEVYTPNGLRLTRDGQFKIDGNGQLTTKQGYPVLKTAPPGTDPAERVIRLSPDLGGTGRINIGDTGLITQSGNGETQELGTLSAVDVENKNSLQKEGMSYYSFRKNFQPVVKNLEQPGLRQGFIESSNVNIVKEMTDLISASRLFETTQKAISAYDSMSDKLVNTVGSTK